MSKTFPVKASLVIAVVLTTILIVGSAVLSRMVFQADQPTAVLALSNNGQSVGINQLFNVDVKLSLLSDASVNGAQFQVNFDSQKLTFVSQTNSPAWRGKIVSQSDGKVGIIVLPEAQLSVSLGGNIEKVLSTLAFRSKDSSLSNVSIDPKSILSATISGQPTNVLASVQDLSVKVTDEISLLDSASKADDSSVQFEEVAPQYLSQRIISVDEFLSYDSALIFVRLQQPAKIRVRYGESASLLNTVEGVGFETESVIRILGMKESAKYQYQITASDQAISSSVSSTVRSFELPKRSAAQLVERVSQKTFPLKTSTTSNIFTIFYDKDDAVIADLLPSIKSSATENIIDMSEIGGIYQVSVSPRFDSKKVVVNKLILGGDELASSNFLYDPKAEDSNQIKTKFPSILSGERTTNVIVILVVSMLLVGLIFRKVLHLK